MKDLPKVFANTIDKEINNSQERAIVSEEKNVNLDEILSSDKYSFNHKYKIELNNSLVVEDSIIQILSDKVLTIDNGWIEINNIKSIVEIKK